MVGGGFKAIKSVVRYALQIGPRALWQTVRSNNACKACAFGTGGQNGGWRNETRQGIELCNKNIQAHLSDIRPGIANTVFFETPIHELAQKSGQALEAMGRLTTPLYKKPGDRHYSPIAYETALQKVIFRLQKAKPDRTFFYASGRSSNEAAFLLQLMARLYGTNNVNNCSYYCHQASGVALGETIGTSTATIEYQDIEQCDTIFVFGANPASNHPRFVKTLINLRRRGGHVIVVNPAKEPGMVKFASPSDWRSMLKGGEKIASEYVQPHLGGDMAFMQGVAKGLLALEALDKTFIAEYTEGFDGFEQSLQAQSWAVLEASSGVTQTQMARVAQIYAKSQKTIFCWSMGLTHHTFGVQNIQTLVALALMRGMVGKPGSGLLPLRGHSNIQGTGSMGFTPSLKAAVLTALEKQCGQRLPDTPGKDTMACMHAADAGEMDVALLLGGNLLASNPDTAFAREALNKVGFKCFLSSTINMGHVQGVDEEVVILPVRVRDEEKSSTTQESMFNFVRLSDGGISRFEHLWSEVDLIGAIGEQVIPKSLFDFSVFSDHSTIRRWIAETIPGYENIASIDISKQEFHIDGRLLHTPKFQTPNGKARFVACALPEKSDYPFTLSSIRSEGQFNSIVYHQYDTYRGQTDRQVLLMHPKDIAKQGWVANQLVTVRSAVGELAGLKVRPFDVREGCVLTYYPEANVLVPNQVDPKSRTPGFKSVGVTVSA